MSFEHIQVLPDMDPGNSIVILTLNMAMARVGLSRSSIYEMMKKGEFPRSVRVGLRRVGWVESEVDAWLQACINARQKKTGG